MAKILFVDDRVNEVLQQWRSSGCESEHKLLPLEVFDSIERTCYMVNTLKPDVVLVGYGLSKGVITGADVIRSLRQEGYTGYIIANSGGGIDSFDRAGVQVDASANRNSYDLKMIIDNLNSRR